jgi:histidyl-tRNA synthetase
VLARLEKFFPEGSVGQNGVRELGEVNALAEALGLSQRVRIDLSIARGLNYYTGTIYEAFLGGLDGFGAVMGGGRYDGLVGVFRGKDVPAVGISLGVDRLLQGLLELGLVNKDAAVVKVLVTVFDAALAPHAARIAQDLRRAGIGCELYPEAARLKKQFTHAERSGMRYVVVAGPEEVAADKASVKDLTTGEQLTMSAAGLAEYLRPRVG